MTSPHTPQDGISSQAFLIMEQRRYASRMAQASAQVAQARDMRELSRAFMGSKTAAHSALRQVLRSSPEHRQLQHTVQVQGEKLIGQALKELEGARALPHEEFMRLQGRFIENYREPCRGDFPQLYHLADRGLLALKAWRHQNLAPVSPQKPGSAPTA